MLASGAKSQLAAFRSLLNRFCLISANTFPQAQGGAGTEGRGRDGGAGPGRREEGAGAEAEVGRGTGEGEGASRHPEAGRACPRAAFPIILSESAGAVSFLPSFLLSSLTPTKPSLIPSSPESFKSKLLKIKAESASSPQIGDKPQTGREACSTWSQQRAWGCTERPQSFCASGQRRPPGMGCHDLEAHGMPGASKPLIPMPCLPWG